MGTTAGVVVVFLTRDPIGYADGPNVYCYVRCNPVTQFDPFGLAINVEAHRVITIYLASSYGYSFSPPSTITEVHFNHTKTTIIPDNQEKWKDHPDFENKTSDGKHYATLGAASKKDNGKLKSKMNRESDVERGENVFETAVRIPEGMTEDEYIQLMIDTDENYNDDETYSALPNKNKKEGYNSNSYTAGLIDATGGTIEEDPPDAPGFDKPLPKEAFSDTKEEATEPNQSQTLPGSNINAH